jgi:hypothetical protein
MYVMPGSWRLEKLAARYGVGHLADQLRRAERVAGPSD